MRPCMERIKNEKKKISEYLILRDIGPKDLKSERNQKNSLNFKKKSGGKEKISKENKKKRITKTTERFCRMDWG